MKNRFAFYLAVLFLAFSGIASAQEQLTTKDAADVSVGRGRTFAEGLSTGDAADVRAGRPANLEERLGNGVNLVEIVARHCSAYEKKPNAIGRLFGKRSGIDAAACAANPSTVFFREVGHNLRTNGGADWQAKVMSATAAPPATANYIALTNNASAADPADCAAGSSTCTLTGEIGNTNGLGRAQGTFAHTDNGTASYTVSKVFSASGTEASQKAALFNASSSGTMVFEKTYTAVTVNSGDTLTVTWTVTY